MSVSTLKSLARKMLQGPLKCVRSSALAAALVPLGAVAIPHTAEAQNTSRVDAVVSPIAGGFDYSYEVVNTSGTPSEGEGGGDAIVDWELPYFDAGDFDALTIRSPSGWAHEVVVAPDYNSSNGQVWLAYDPATDPLLDPNQGGDPDLYGPNPEVFDTPPLVLHWYLFDFSSGNPIFPGDSLDGFGFESTYNSLNAPYMASWQKSPPLGGDPPIPGSAFGSPLSPARITAQNIPEPGMSLLAIAGAAGGVLVLRRRK